MRPIVTALTLGLTLAIHTRQAPAQADSILASAHHDLSTLSLALIELEDESRIRVEVPRNLLDSENPRILTPRGKVELRNPNFSPTAIYYSDSKLPGWASAPAASFPRPLPLSQVFRLEARRDVALGGAVTGASLGLAVGLTTGYAAACSTSSDKVCLGNWGTVARAVGGGAAGALLGYVLGKGIKRWKTVYYVGPEPTRKPSLNR